MYPAVLQIHHYVAFIALLLLLVSTLIGISGMGGNKDFTDSNRKLCLFTLISCHIMLLLGLILLVVSPMTKAAFGDMAMAMKDAVIRKAAVEHPFTNVIAVILVTIGYGKIKRGNIASSRYKSMAIYFGIALLLILSRLDFGKLFSF